ncbi:MAG TPA: VOC family protein [Actinopolymorphaceae bacterium]
MPDDERHVTDAVRGVVRWHELRTSDPAAAVAFYPALFGWTIQERGHRTEFRLGATPVAALHRVTPGTPPAWLPVIEVDDLDDAADRVASEEGQITVSPADHLDLPGRVGLVTHPIAGEFGLMEPAGGLPPLPDAPAPGGGREDPGRFGWHELESPDPSAAAAFLRNVVGWTSTAGLLRDRSGRTVAGVVEAVDGTPAHWLSFVVVPDLAEIVRRTTELGALVVVPRTTIASGAAACVIRDHDGVTLGCLQR